VFIWTSGLARLPISRLKEARSHLPGWKFLHINTHKRTSLVAGMKVQRYSRKLFLLSFQLKCSSNIDSIHYLGLTNSFDRKLINILLLLNEPIRFRFRTDWPIGNTQEVKRNLNSYELINLRKWIHAIFYQHFNWNEVTTVKTTKLSRQATWNFLI
jgi:hypothetical protein